MKPSPFTHLHTHSHYSLLNALPKVDELVKAAKADGMDALALTDAVGVTFPATDAVTAPPSYPTDAPSPRPSPISAPI